MLGEGLAKSVFQKETGLTSTLRPPVGVLSRIRCRVRIPGRNLLTNDRENVRRFVQDVRKSNDSDRVHLMLISDLAQDFGILDLELVLFFTGDKRPDLLALILPLLQLPDLVSR